ncbi:acyl-phosphate glycerol 3-phosphate acyltransferase [Wolbachia pipientis]|uniref:Glycerol-3-phosphate acyltransferase n=1 Tax=Wolbachia pipientis TaxID=955 RepID=A0A1E7QKT3_WOLPI|nr:glycerol-3-phosphate 1-O-acyltransferase PlsY [Wolbachia pipientis]OEY87090.1 acyl-phosphate glycerol 3-phosphate acyltransferase [Wolbachia pipientis]
MELILSYILGSIPFSLIITRIQGIELRKIGSGNIGATNVLRTGNKKLAVCALLLDAMKGFIAVYISQKFYCAAAILAVLGHMFPLWLKFKGGGKGVATTLGVLLALDIQIVLVFLFTWVVVFLIFRYSSLASLSAMAAATIASFFLSDGLFLTLFIIAVLVFCKHHQNIINLWQGSEYKF